MTHCHNTLDQIGSKNISRAEPWYCKFYEVPPHPHIGKHFSAKITQIKSLTKIYRYTGPLPRIFIYTYRGRPIVPLTHTYLLFGPLWSNKTFLQVKAIKDLHKSQTIRAHIRPEQIKSHFRICTEVKVTVSPGNYAVI